MPMLSVASSIFSRWLKWARTKPRSSTTRSNNKSLVAWSTDLMEFRQLALLQCHTLFKSTPNWACHQFLRWSILLDSIQCYTASTLVRKTINQRSSITKTLSVPTPKTELVIISSRPASKATSKFLSQMDQWAICSSMTNQLTSAHWTDLEKISNMTVAMNIWQLAIKIERRGESKPCFSVDRNCHTGKLSMSSHQWLISLLRTMWIFKEWPISRGERCIALYNNMWIKTLM